MRYKEPFTIFKRKVPSGSFIYYYSTYDELGRRKQYSTGTKSKTEAKKICYELFKKDRLIQPRIPTFAEYTKEWYVVDKCPYSTARIACQIQNFLNQNSKIL